LSSGGGTSKVTWGKALNTTIGGAAGGGIYIAPQFMFKLPWWGKALYAVGTSVVAAKMKYPSVGAGIAGAYVQDMAKTMLSTALKDLDDTDYVDASTLSDSGYLDEDGNAVMMDDDGNMYALSDNGSYALAGNMQELEQGSNIQDVSMIPLQDPYSSPYSLQDAYALSDPNSYMY